MEENPDGDGGRMVKRLLWLGVGLAVGALVVRAVTKKAQTLSPSGLAASARGSLAGLVDSVRDFVDDVREGMAEREEQIQAAFGEGVALDELGEEREG
jgi:hypothetical protein